MAIHKFTKLIRHGEEVPMYGEGNTRRDYTYISDIIDGVNRSIDHCHGYHIYNLGESKTVELRKLVDLIAYCLGEEPKIRILPLQPGDVSVTYADISKAKSELGYSPEVDIVQGIERFVAWYKEKESILN
jgi:UDP-glucuronate 4-epimerase